jgi:hypothetical protein
MNYYVIFLETKNEAVPGTELHKILTDFKKSLALDGKVVVVHTIESNYDFLYNSLIEKARFEEKR